MRTIKCQSERVIPKIFPRRFKIIPIFGFILIISISSCTTPFMISQYPDGGYAAPPTWAQNYDNDNPVNYYYLPDIETYYDLRNNEFVYLDDGNWRFSASLPSVYASFDLNNCFVVKLNNTVHEPWMHFHNYVAHYPRYYYKSIEQEGNHDNNRTARWFNENLKQYGYASNQNNNEFINRNENRQGSGAVHDQNVNFTNRANNQVANHIEIRQNSTPRQDQNNPNLNQKEFNYDGNHNNTRQNQDSRHDQPQRNEATMNRVQPMKYYGKQIGQPVKVQKNMMKPKEDKRSTKIQDNRDQKR